MLGLYAAGRLALHVDSFARFGDGNCASIDHEGSVLQDRSAEPAEIQRELIHLRFA